MLQTGSNPTAKVSFCVEVVYDPEETNPEAMLRKLSDSLTFVEGIGQIDITELESEKVAEMDPHFWIQKPGDNYRYCMECGKDQRLKNGEWSDVLPLFGPKRVQPECGTKA